MVNYQHKKIAVLMLACQDYEAMELALACHMTYGDLNTPFFILQNCKGNYDAQRALQVAKRYQNLYPKQIHVIDDIGPSFPYKSISHLLESAIFKEFDLICKVDDDAFPIAPNWLEKLRSLWLSKKDEYQDQLAYVTPLINNNTWGFQEILKIMDLEQVYFDKYARDHYTGPANDRKFNLASSISTGQDGTIWQFPYLARWIHERTTLDPDSFVAATKNLKPVAIPSDDRYSIGCIFFEKELWWKIDDGGSDDEHMLHKFCKNNSLKIFCERSTPFVHMSYFSQRGENRDITETAKELYQNRLNLPYPIGLKKNRLLEIEERLRWLEANKVINKDPNTNLHTEPMEQIDRSRKNLIKKLLSLK